MEPQTLRTIAGANWLLPPLSECVLLIVDAQDDYRQGKLPLHEIEPAIAEAAAVLDKARNAGAPVIHIVQMSPPASPIFARGSAGAAIIKELTPRDGEIIVEKTLPDSFAQTTLLEHLRQFNREWLIVIGYMTHMCVSTTVRSAVHLGFRTAIVASACATRPLPDPAGDVIPAAAIHRAELAALNDRFAIVLPTAADLDAIAG